MKLSPVYKNKIFWVMVYDTGHHPNLPEVEMVDEVFFASSAKAYEWFRGNYKFADFINPRAIPISGFQNLEFVDPLRVP